MTVIEDLRWEARLTKSEIARRAGVMLQTFLRAEKEGIASVTRENGKSIVAVLSDRLIELGKRTEPLDYWVLVREEEEGKAPPQRAIA